MKAAVFKGRNHIEIIEKDKPEIQNPKDAIIRVLYTSICGTDIHMYHTKAPIGKNHILGHECVGIVEEIGSEVTFIKPGDRVLATSSIACGQCEFCQKGEYSQCLRSNPNIPERGAAFLGSPPQSGGYEGVQAEYARIPYASYVLYKIPEGITDTQALILTDILPTGYHGTEIVDLQPGESVAIYGAGPVGQMAALCAKLKGAGAIYIVDSVPARLEMARQHTGAIPLNYKELNPQKEIKKRTNKLGVDKVIDAVGLEAETNLAETLEQAVMLETSSTQALTWAIGSVKSSGIVGLIGLYAGWINHFPIDMIFYNNITLKGGNAPHKKYLDTLVRYIQEGKMDPSYVITKEYSFDDIKEAYHCFDKEKEECVKELIKVA